MVQDKVLRCIAPKVGKFATIYGCDNQQVSDFNKSKSFPRPCIILAALAASHSLLTHSSFHSSFVGRSR